MAQQVTGFAAQAWRPGFRFLAHCLKAWEYTQEMPYHTTKHLFNYVHSRTICNSQNLVPLIRRMHKEGMTHIYFRVLLSGKNQYLELCMQMDGNRKYFTE